MGISNGTGSGGDFLKPEEHKDAKGILIEPKKILRGQSGKFGPRDILVADWTIFKTKDDLEGAQPLVIQSAKLDKKRIVEDMEDKLGEMTVGKFVALPNSKGPHPIWVIRPVDQAVFERIVAYVEQRDADLAAAMDEDLPDWAA